MVGPTAVVPGMFPCLHVRSGFVGRTDGPACPAPRGKRRQPRFPSMSFRTLKAALVIAALPLGLLSVPPLAHAGTTQATVLDATPSRALGMFHDDTDQPLPPL